MLVLTAMLELAGAVVPMRNPSTIPYTNANRNVRNVDIQVNVTKLHILKELPIPLRILILVSIKINTSIN